MSTPSRTAIDLSRNPSVITLVAPSPSPSSPSLQIGAQQPKKRYDFARGFSPDTITIFDGLHPAYHLLDRKIISRVQSKTILLRRVDDQLVERGTYKASNEGFRMRTCCRRLESGSGVEYSRLFWLWTIYRSKVVLAILGRQSSRYSRRQSPSSSSMLSSILATASFSQSATLAKIISIEVVDDVTETLLIYIFISASIIELDLGKRKRREAQRWLGGAGTSSWAISP